MRVRLDDKGETVIGIPSFSADEIRRLSDSADAEPLPCSDTIQAVRDGAEEILRRAGMEIECLRQELAAERRCTAAYQARLAKVADKKAAPAGWLWFLTGLAAWGVIRGAQDIAVWMGWLR